MVVLFLLSLPGLVVALIVLGMIQMIRAKGQGKKRPGAGSIGLEMLDTVLKPGTEHLRIEKESKRVKRKEDQEGAPPFDHTTGVIKIKREAK